jgi:putative transcriptional regulator
MHVSVADLRTKLGLNQTQFGTLLGVHPMTVSKWEREILQPTPYQQALMAEFVKAAEDEDVRKTTGAVLIGLGIAAALFMLLKAAKG